MSHRPYSAFPRRRPRTSLARSLLLCVSFLAVAVSSVRAQVASREYDLKAAFVYNFATFGDWPPTAFATPQSPFVIGVLGTDPFGRSLQEIVAGERIKGRPIVIQRFDRASSALDCHILFVCASERGRLREILSLFRDRPVLTVGDVPGFVEAGGCVGFTTTTRIGIQINPVALKAGHLAMSPKLLRLAEIVAADLPPP